ncbi:MAG TPA: hypothetical protein V6D47_14475 [Oscillatoriaceae cyanobacterium]
MRSWLSLLLVIMLVTPAQASPDPWPAIRAAYLAGEDAQALAQLHALLAADPRDLMANYYTGLIAIKEGDRATATHAFTVVAKLDPDGPFGADARSWLDDLPAPAAPSPTPIAPAPLPIVVPSPLPSHEVKLAPHRPGWLTALPLDKGHDARNANPDPGYFKASDGSFEFKPPTGFRLLDEGDHGDEERLLFGPPGAETAYAAADSPPTLLITWHAHDELAGLDAATCAQRERQLLFHEAAGYGPGGELVTRFGVTCYRIPQREGTWAAETWLLFKNQRLYAFTYGGDADKLATYRSRVEASLLSPIFYR